MFNTMEDVDRLYEALVLQEAVDRDLGGIGKEWEHVLFAAALFRGTPALCEGDSCPCLYLEASLGKLLAKAAQQRPGLDVMIELKVHSSLTGNALSAFRDCPHAAATRLAIAEAYYKLVAMPEYRRLAAEAAAAAAAAGSSAAAAAAAAAAACSARPVDECTPIEAYLCTSKALQFPPPLRRELQTQWAKVLRRLQKAAEALPPNNQPLKPANAAKLSVWIAEGDKGIDGRLTSLLPVSHTLVLWAAAVCRVAGVNVFTLQLSERLVRPAAALAAGLLDVTTYIGRLSAAGISFRTQPSPAAVAAALDLAAQVSAALAPYQYALLSNDKAYGMPGPFDLADSLRQQQQPPPPHQPLPMPPLYLNPLQQQRQQGWQQPVTRLSLYGLQQIAGEVKSDWLPATAHTMLAESQQLLSLGAPVLCFYGTRLLQHWEEQLLQQQQQQQHHQQQGHAVPPTAPAASAAAVGGGSGGGCPGGDSSSSSSNRPAWQEAEGLLLLGAAALEAPAAPHHHQKQQQQQQHQQQQLALCKQYQLQFQRAASSLGLSSGLMAAVAAWHTEAAQYSSSSGGGGGGGGSSSNSSSGGRGGGDFSTAGSIAAAADCLSAVYVATMLQTLGYTLVDPVLRAAAQKQRRLTSADELVLAGFLVQGCTGNMAATRNALLSKINMCWLA